ncbi:hypothetical protein NDA18_004877 [Ustilago nuda]|nr:hypothetical protein NDA18_004877 [Ustilago nuda]
MAYLNSTLKEAIYMKPPEGAGVAPGQVYKVVKGLYGLKQSRREWNQKFDRSLQHMGFFQVECAPCIYTKGQGEDMAIVVIYVDDTLAIAPRLEMVLKSILEGTLVASTAQQKEYPVIIGKLLWVANSTQPDLSLTVRLLARHMQEPSQEHYQAAQRALHYLKSTKEVGLVYRANELQEPLVAHRTPMVYSDNTGCIQVSKDPAQHWKLKHIDTKYHFVRNNVQEGKVQIKYVDMTQNLADVLTKPIGRQVMQQARSGLHLQIPAVAHRTGSPSYATVLKDGGHVSQQQHNEQSTYTVEGGVEVDKATQSMEVVFTAE